MATLGDWASTNSHRLVAAGIDRPDALIDVEVLARHVLGWSRAQWLSRNREPAPEGFRTKADPLVARRCQREPVAQIVGVREFWGLDIEITPDVLTPRPESELLVETTLTKLVNRSAPWTIVDVGTGSGCLAIALASELPLAHIVATDVSPSALRVARRNAARHQTNDRTTFRETRFLNGLDGPYDLVVSNPPYIPDREMTKLPPEVGLHEPDCALRGGPDGLDPARSLANAAASRLRVGGWLLVEIGVDQSTEIPFIAGTAGLTLIEIVADIRGIPRVAAMQNSGTG